MGFSGRLLHYYAPNVIYRKEIASETWFKLKLLRFSERDYLTNQVKLPSSPISDFYQIPSNRVVEIGSQIEI